MELLKERGPKIIQEPTRLERILGGDSMPEDLRMRYISSIH